MPKMLAKKGFPVAYVAAGLVVPLVVVAWLVLRPGKPKPVYAANPDPAPAVQPQPKEDDNNLVALAAPPPKTSKEFTEKVRPLLKKYCIGCHNDDKVAGGMTLEGYTDEATAIKDRKIWEAVKEAVHRKEMPPKDKPKPTDAERLVLVNWIENSLTKVDCGLAKDPGRPTIRRLNRAEYNNTIRDLIGVNFQPA